MTMPGILPMKVIKVGTSAQSRIAQACDRCRSKKIRCDGFRPCCTQCANVGFECKTSDKLSRRAFPRGYTESLEERVRALETEVRELKDLLDEKDEKIDMLSRMNDQSPQRNRSPSMASAANDRKSSQGSMQQEKDEHFKLQQSVFLVEGEYTDSYFVGSSSTRAFIDSCKRKLQESGKSCTDWGTGTFFPSAPNAVASRSPAPSNAQFWAAPPRLPSDQMVNIFFQEWAPMFPVLHRPTFLALYEQYVTDSSSVQDKRSLAQLNLVFCIAALSNENRIAYDTSICENQWLSAIDSFLGETSLASLQCLTLAQIYCIQKGDANRLVHYKSLAVGISQRLGLHLNQKRFALGALTVETRKKVFWTLYTLDCFSAAYLGLPKVLTEENIHCEYPVDTDDEYVTEKGFQPTLPGESTKLSSALALFRGARVLAKVLAVNYPAAASQELSLRSISELEEDLDAWASSLSPHLRLEFAQDKPSTNVTSSRSPILSLTYSYIRILIHRPALCANLGSKAASSNVALASANKRMVQVIQLLDERGLSFSHCLNKNELLLLSGFGLLFQSLELDKEGKLLKDSQKLVGSVIDMLSTRAAPGAAEFKDLSSSVLSVGDVSSTETTGSLTKASSTDTTATSTSSSHNQLAALAARYTLVGNAAQSKQKPENDPRKSSVASSPADRLSRRPSEKSLRPLAPLTAHQKTTLSPMSADTPASDNSSKGSPKQPRNKSSSLPAPTNLDYFSFPNDPTPRQPAQRKPPPTTDPTVWERLLNTLGNSPYQSDESMYEWPAVDNTFLSPADAELSNGHTQNGNNMDTTWGGNTWNSNDFSNVEIPRENDAAFRGVMIPHFTPENGFSPAGNGGEFDTLQNDNAT